jgi:hypothetical protein
VPAFSLPRHEIVELERIDRQVVPLDARRLPQPLHQAPTERRLVSLQSITESFMKPYIYQSIV